MTAPDPQPTLAAFLLARLAEEATVAANALDQPMGHRWRTLSWLTEANREHGLRHDPARVLADVAAKKKIAAEHMQRPDGGCYDCETSLCRFQLFLAQPYADHSDFRAAWAL